MRLENIMGNIVPTYKELQSGTFQHADQLTTERRTNRRLRKLCFTTADGELYTVQKRKVLWAITREPQNLILQNIGEADAQFLYQGNYFPDTEAARASLEHHDTIILDLNGLKLVKDNNNRSGYFVVDPKAINDLNSEQRKAAQRIFGPDEENFGLNMEMFAKANRQSAVFTCTPDYVQEVLRSNHKTLFSKASCLDWIPDDPKFFAYSSSFYAHIPSIHDTTTLRGVRRG